LDNGFNREPMLEMFIFETLHLTEQLEKMLLESEKSSSLESEINEIFRIMHTIKGSAAMMLFNNIAILAHSVEDLFYYIREDKPDNIGYSSLCDIVLECVDFIKSEITKIECQQDSDGDPALLVDRIKKYLSKLKQDNGEISDRQPDKPVGKNTGEQKFYISSYKASPQAVKSSLRAVISFVDGCEMENIRAFSVVHSLKEVAEIIGFTPGDIIDNPDSADLIKQNGFTVWFYTDRSCDEIKELLSQTVFLKHLDVAFAGEEELEEFKSAGISGEERQTSGFEAEHTGTEHSRGSHIAGTRQNMISVNLSKLDKLMDLVGELVVSEAMVTRNPDLEGLNLDNFNKASRQLRKITGELQDVVMSIRMVPLSMTFHKMNRIVRDMCKKLGKEAELQIIGEETEVDKNIIEHLSDPLMHLIRNSLDHGIETADERVCAGKPHQGKITLEAKNAGGDVWIIVKDDGRGLNRDKILSKAKENGLLTRPESDISDREVYSFIFLPGFSTKDKVTEFSGRGVGMDVVTKNIEKIGGTILVDSKPGEGTVISVKIPLTLAIINGMQVKVGNSKYTIPTTSIRESFRVGENDLITDPDGNEMLMVRGQCYPVMRLHTRFDVNTPALRICEGIVIMVDDNSKNVCLFADALLGEQQVVVKALPKYLKKVSGISGCTLLGDGSISLILDTAGLVDN